MNKTVISFFALAVLTVAAFAPAMAQNLPVSDLSIVTASGKRHVFKVELAENDESRSRGLMHRKQMAADAGMLFDFKREQMLAFWMKNTLIPLDMFFIRADGTIINIHERAIPHDETSIPSAAPAQGVLELNGGSAARLGIKPGDRVVHPVFRSAGK